MSKLLLRYLRSSKIKNVLEMHYFIMFCGESDLREPYFLSSALFSAVTPLQYGAVTRGSQEQRLLDIIKLNIIVY